MGTRTAESEVKLTFTSTIKNTLTDGQVAQLSLSEIVASGKLQTGVSADQANRAWIDQGRSLLSGATEDIDFYDFVGEDIGAGAGADGLGQPLALEEIVTIVVRQTGGPGRLEIMPTRPANDATWIPSLTVSNGGALKPNGVFMMHQPDTDAFDIADGVSHMARFGANGGDVTYDIYLLARHDDDESSSSSSSTSSVSSSSSTSSLSSSSSSSLSTTSVSSSSSSTSSVSSSSSSSLSSQSSSSSTSP